MGSVGAHSVSSLQSYGASDFVSSIGAAQGSHGASQMYYPTHASLTSADAFHSYDAFQGASQMSYPTHASLTSADAP